MSLVHDLMEEVRRAESAVDMWQHYLVRAKRASEVEAIELNENKLRGCRERLGVAKRALSAEQQARRGVREELA